MSLTTESSRILLIDNFDSFTYNIVHLLRSLGIDADDVEVVRNTRLELDCLGEYDAVVSSPGPGLPETSGQLLATVDICLREQIPYLGICLGLQALGMATGGHLRRLAQVRHGVQHSCRVTSANPLLRGLPEDFDVGRYHSWVIDEATLPDSLNVIAATSDGVIQAAAYAHGPAWGVQFHPESIMSPEAGPIIVGNFLALAGALRATKGEVYV